MNKKISNILLLVVILSIFGVIIFDQTYLSGLEKKFMKIESVRIETSNRLATAKIVHENLNHVRGLVFENMDFPGQPDTLGHETHLFNFITSCINDLKLKLVSVKPVRPTQSGLITTYGYDIEIQGDFFKFGELCSKFENSRRIVSLETFDVSLMDHEEKALGGPENKMIHVKMRINSYRVKKS